MNCYVKFVELITVLVVVRLIKMFRRGKKMGRGRRCKASRRQGLEFRVANYRLYSPRKFRGYCTWSVEGGANVVLWCSLRGHTCRNVTLQLTLVMSQDSLDNFCNIFL